MHQYEKAPRSHAGNCVCGMARESQAHPHAFAKAAVDGNCVCALPRGHFIHGVVAQQHLSPREER